MTTQRAIFSYEEVIDLHTEADTVSVIGIHTPTGDTARKLCPGFFQQFKKYKYLGCSVALVPAATLPADPLSVSYEAGEPTIDPRDMLNPIMFHGCHGNDIGNILNRLYSSGLADSSDLTQILHSDSTDFMSMYNGMDDGTPVLQILESLYYRALTDKTWKKANIQRGFRKSGLRPRIYSLATNMQLMGQTSLGTQRAPGVIEGTVDLTDPFNPNMDLEDPVVNPVRYFTPRTVPLGWLDTRQVVPYVAEGTVEDVTFDELNNTITDLVKGKTVWNELPLIYMGIILMPPAYKTEQYFRMVINHHFAFAGFRGISMSNDMIEMPPNYEDWNEVISSHEGGDDPPEPEPPQPEYEYVTGTGILELYGTKSGTPLNYSVSFSPGLYDDAPDPQTYVKSGGNTDYRIASQVQVIDSDVTVTVVNGGTTNVVVYNKLTSSTIVTVEPGTSGSFVFNPADNLGTITSGGNNYSNAFGLMFFGGF